MGHYAITMVTGFSTFEWLLCEHSVSTRDFSGLNGNCRTLAARAVNEHAMAGRGFSGALSLREAQMWYAH